MQQNGEPMKLRPGDTREAQRRGDLASKILICFVPNKTGGIIQGKGNQLWINALISGHVLVFLPFVSSTLTSWTDELLLPEQSPLSLTTNQGLDALLYESAGADITKYHGLRG